MLVIIINAVKNLNHTIVSESRSNKANFKNIAKKPHKRAVLEANNKPFNSDVIYFPKTKKADHNMICLKLTKREKEIILFQLHYLLLNLLQKEFLLLVLLLQQLLLLVLLLQQFLLLALLLLQLFVLALQLLQLLLL